MPQDTWISLRIFGYSNLNIPQIFLDIQNFRLFNSMTLGNAQGHLNILKDIRIFKFEYPQIYWIFRIFRIFNSMTLGDALGHVFWKIRYILNIGQPALFTSLDWGLPALGTKNVPRAGCPGYIFVPRAASPKYKTVPQGRLPLVHFCTQGCQPWGTVL